MKIFSQQDPRWKDKTLGLDNSGYTIGQAGCFLTCFSMIVEVEPDKFNDRMKVYGGFDSANPAWICPGVVPNAYKQIYVEQIWCTKTPAPISLIDDALSIGRPVIVQLDTSPVEGIQSHFVILTKKISPNDYEMIDPWPLTDIPRGSVIARYGKDANGKNRKIEEVICYVAFIGGAKLDVEEAAPPSTELLPSQESSDSLITLFNDSKLRVGPGLGSRIICTLPAGIELTRFESSEVIKDGYSWAHVDCWVATGTADGKKKFIK